MKNCCVTVCLVFTATYLCNKILNMVKMGGAKATVDCVFKDYSLLVEFTCEMDLHPLFGSVSDLEHIIQIMCKE